MKRVFIALPVIPGQIFLDAYHDIQKQLYNEPVKWVDENNLHLTLKFLGETEDEKIRILKEKLLLLKNDFSAFEFSLNGFGYFGSKRQPTVIWAGIDNQEVMKQMAVQVDKLASDLGFEPESRPFKAHLTIGRIKFVKDSNTILNAVESYNDRFFQKMIANKLILFESILTQKGPIYKPLLTVNL